MLLEDQEHTDRQVLVVVELLESMEQMVVQVP
jgi:hypothetical protein